MEQLEEKIRAALDEVRPGLQNDGGDVELVAIDGKTVTLQLTGQCGSCPYAMMTLKNGIENYLREQVDPEITVVRAQ